MIGSGVYLANQCKPPLSGAPVLMDSVSPNALADLDATFYDGTQTWADAMDGTAFDMYLGATSAVETSDTTFATDKFTFDGNDFFKLVAVTNPDLYRDMHKTTGGAPATITIAFKTPASLANIVLFSTATNTASNGMDFLLLSSGGMRLRQFNGSTTSNNNFGSWAVNTSYVVTLAFDFTGGTFKYSINARTFTSTTLSSGASTTDASFTMRIGGNNVGSLLPTSGTELFGFYPFSGLLTDGELSTAIDILNDRHPAINIA